MEKLTVSVPTSDLYVSAVNFIQTGELERAKRLLELIWHEPEAGVNKDVVASALGSIHLKQGDIDRAIELFNKAVVINPDVPAYRTNLATAFMMRFEPGKALSVVESFEDEADSFLNTLPVEDRDRLITTKATALNSLKEYDKASEALLELDPSKPQNSVYLGMNLMRHSISPGVGGLNGIYEYRERTKSYKSLIPKGIQNWWDVLGLSFSLPKELNILLEQGLGDCIMMLPDILKTARVLPDLLDLRGKKKVRVISIDGRHDAFINDIVKSFESETLSGLCLSAEELIGLSGEFVWMFDLLGFRSHDKYGRDDTDPSEAYIQVNPQIKALARQYEGKVGICWRGNPSHQNDHWRSAKLSDYHPILWGYECVSLQMDITPNELEELKPWETAYWVEKGLIALAAIISNLKCVVTVDTAISHLAGAIGVPCITLLPTNSDWRWGERGEKSIWYKSHTLLRQEQCGDWSGPIDEAVRRVNGIR